jgi:cytochrome P450
MLTVDTGYLFGESYEGLGEKSPIDDSGRKIKSERLSASGFVDTFVAVGRFFLLPSSVFLFLEGTLPKLFPNPEVDKSMAVVSAYVDSVVSGDKTSPTHDTYQSRLLKAGISKHETSAQCMDLIFAGTDSTGMNLATTFFQLARHAEKHSRLHQELLNAPPTADLQTLPYLRAVIRESLRISMANPTRLPRVVPTNGWSFAGYSFPSGTNVGCALHTLHFNPAIYAAPFDFRPERWLDDTEDNMVTPEMNRDHIPFGLGTRSCIAKNLAMAELYAGVSKVVLSGVLDGASTDVERIEIDEWFNSKVKGGKIMLRWK